MNKQIELVEKWLADNDSVSQAQLEANATAAYAANAAAYAIYADAYAAYANANATNAAAYAATDAYANAAIWVAKYHSLVKEKRP